MFWPKIYAALLTTLLALAAHAAAAADSSAELDCHAWRQLPVFHRGRIMPLDSYAREAVETVCGRASPRLGPDGTPQGGPELAAARALFPDGRPRTFTAAEILLSWMVEPEKWENVPFLAAEHEDLRKDLLGLPVFAAAGQRLKYVSPRQVQRARMFHARLSDLAEREQQADKEGRQLELAGLDKQVKTLFNAYTLFRLLTFNPSAVLDSRDKTITDLRSALEIWNQREPFLSEMHNLMPGEVAAAALGRARDATRQLRDLAGRGQLNAKNIEPILAAMRQATATLAEEYTKFGRQPPLTMRSEEQQVRGWRSEMNHLSKDLDEISRLTAAAQLALYDSGQSLRLVPALNPDALKADRDAGRRAVALAGPAGAALRLRLHGRAISSGRAEGGPRELPADGRRLHGPRGGRSPGRLRRTPPAALPPPCGTLGRQIEPLRRRCRSRIATKRCSPPPPTRRPATPTSSCTTTSSIRSAGRGCSISWPSSAWHCRSA